MRAESMKKVMIWLGILTGSALVLLIAFSAWVYWKGKELIDVEDVKNRYVIEYIEKEQTRLGINCHELKGKLSAFLDDSVGPILKAQARGEKPIVTGGLK